MYGFFHTQTPPGAAREAVGSGTVHVTLKTAFRVLKHFCTAQKKKNNNFKIDTNSLKINGKGKTLNLLGLDCSNPKVTRLIF